RSTHPEQQRLGEPLALDLRGDVVQVLDVCKLVVGHSEPAEPTAFVLARPQRRVARPQAPYLPGGFPILERLSHVGFDGLREGRALAVARGAGLARSEEHTSELQSRENLVW